MTTNPPLRILSSGWKSLLQARSRSTRRLGEWLVVATTRNCQHHHCRMSRRSIGVQFSVDRGISGDSMRTGRNRCTAAAAASFCNRHNSRNSSRLSVAHSPIRRTLHKNNHNKDNHHHHPNSKHHHHRHKNAAAVTPPQQPHSTTTAAAAAPSILYAPTAAAATATTAAAVDPLSNVSKWQKLRSLFITGAIPMIGFGFMDNFVMIQAGQYIDSTIGVQLGLATMTAAACGQVVSDVSGVLMGGTLERTVGRFRYFRKHAQISHAARQTVPWAKNVTLAGAVVGVICGCAMGASTLLLVDLEARDRIHHATQLRDIVTDMLKIGAEEHCLAETSCTVYVASRGEYTLTKNNDDQDERSVRLAFLNDGECDAVQLCAKRREVLMHQDCLCAPILRDDEVVGVLEFHLPSEVEVFTLEHAKAAKVMAHHLGIVMKHLVEA